MFGLLFTVVLILSVVLGNVIGLAIMKVWEDFVNDKLILGFALDCAVALGFVTLSMIAEICIPAAAIIYVFY